MKKLVLALAVCAALTFAACGNRATKVAEPVAVETVAVDSVAMEAADTVMVTAPACECCE